MPKTIIGRVVLIHGVRVRKNNRDLYRLATAFRAAGFCVTIPRYGYIPACLIGAIPWLDNRIADSMAGFIEPGDILVGHSNGATLAYLISKRHPLRGAVLINPALECDAVPNADFVHVYHNEGDLIVRLAALIPFNIWGAMGAVGYCGSNPLVVSIDQARPPGELPALHGHSDIFQPMKVRPWARFIADMVLAAVKH